MAAGFWSCHFHWFPSWPWTEQELIIWASSSKYAKRIKGGDWGEKEKWTRKCLQVFSSLFQTSMSLSLKQRNWDYVESPMHSWYWGSGWGGMVMEMLRKDGGKCECSIVGWHSALRILEGYLLGQILPSMIQLNNFRPEQNSLLAWIRMVLDGGLLQSQTAPRDDLSMPSAGGTGPWQPSG